MAESTAQALNSFLADVERRAFRMAQMALRHDEDALDAVQDAMLQLVRRYSGRPGAEWRPLFYRILENRIRDLQRRRTVRGPPDRAVHDPVGAGARAPAGAPRDRLVPARFDQDDGPPSAGRRDPRPAPRRLARDPSRPASPSAERPPAAAGRIPLDRLRRRRLDPSVRRRHGAVARLRTATATSAGGIVVRFDDGIPSLVVGARRRDRDILTWTLPKGTPNPGESREQTALREVAEETGLEVRITDVLDSIEYWFVQRGTRIHKTVHYFLMDQTGGDLGRHDHEFETVRWVPFDEAQSLLTFETERALVARAAAAVAARDGGDDGREEDPPRATGTIAPAGHGA